MGIAVAVGPEARPQAAKPEKPVAQIGLQIEQQAKLCISVDFDLCAAGQVEAQIALRSFKLFDPQS